MEEEKLVCVFLVQSSKARRGKGSTNSLGRLDVWNGHCLKLSSRAPVVGIVQRAWQRTVQLYVDSVLQITKIFKTAPIAKIRPGYIGCWMSDGSITSRKFTGSTQCKIPPLRDLGISELVGLRDRMKPLLDLGLISITIEEGRISAGAQSCSGSHLPKKRANWPPRGPYPYQMSVLQAESHRRHVTF